MFYFILANLIRKLFKLFTANDGEVCSIECSAAGCWGKGPDQCLECQHFVYKGTCLSNCKSLKK